MGKENKFCRYDGLRLLGWLRCWDNHLNVEYVSFAVEDIGPAFVHVCVLLYAIRRHELVFMHMCVFVIMVKHMNACTKCLPIYI
jgi:hypothetical protein